MATIDLTVDGKTEKAVTLETDLKINPSLIRTGTASGVAPLGTASKVPMAYILSDVAGGLPVLDSSARVPSARLPTYLPQNPRVWRDVTSSRAINTWYTNTSGNEMDLHLVSNNMTNNNGLISLFVRANSSSPTINLRGFEISGSNTSGRLYNGGTVPIGWQYQVANLNSRVTEFWLELS